MTVTDSSSAGVKWLENVSGSQNAHNTTVVVGIALLILAASCALTITIVVYRRFRTKRHDEESLWVTVSEKRRSRLSALALDGKLLEPDLNPNWVPFRAPKLSSVPQVHLRTPPPPTQRPFLRSLVLCNPPVTPQPESAPAPAAPAPAPVDAEMTPKPTQTEDAAPPSQDTPPAIARSPPRLTVKVPPLPNLATTLATPTPSPRSVKFLPGPPSSTWRTEARGRWTRATQVLRSPVVAAAAVRAKAIKSPLTASFLEGGSKKKANGSKAQAARRAEAEREFWSACTSPPPVSAVTTAAILSATVSPATHKLNQLILDMEKEYQALGKM